PFPGPRSPRPETVSDKLRSAQRLKLRKLAQLVQALLAARAPRGDTPVVRAESSRVKAQTTVVGDHQGPGEADAIGAFLLGIGRDSYTTYNLPASGTLTIGRGESNAVRIDDPLASRAHARLHVRVDGDSGMYLEGPGNGQ